MPVKESTKAYYEKVRKEYEKLSSVKEFGVRKYTPEWCYAKIAAKWYKSPKTIENIVWFRA